MNHEELDKLGISGIGQAKKSTQAVGNFQLNQLKLVGFLVLMIIVDSCI